MDEIKKKKLVSKVKPPESVVGRGQKDQGQGWKDPEMGPPQVYPDPSTPPTQSYLAAKEGIAGPVADRDEYGLNRMTANEAALDLSMHPEKKKPPRKVN